LIDIGGYFVVRESKELDAAGFQVLLTCAVFIAPLLMHGTIHFDRQTGLNGVEVDDESRDRVLPAELESAQTFVT
jgi:hypothetical protein